MCPSFPTHDEDVSPASSRAWKSDDPRQGLAHESWRVREDEPRRKYWSQQADWRPQEEPSNHRWTDLLSPALFLGSFEKPSPYCMNLEPRMNLIDKITQPEKNVFFKQIWDESTWALLWDCSAFRSQLQHLFPWSLRGRLLICETGILISLPYKVAGTTEHSGVSHVLLGALHGCSK